MDALSSSLALSQGGRRKSARGCGDAMDGGFDRRGSVWAGPRDFVRVGLREPGLIRGGGRAPSQDGRVRGFCSRCGFGLLVRRCSFQAAVPRRRRGVCASARRITSSATRTAQFFRADATYSWHGFYIARPLSVRLSSRRSLAGVRARLSGAERSKTSMGCLYGGHVILRIGEVRVQ